MALLEVKDLRVSYSFPVILGVSFEVEQGETCVLFGLNGAGKTTTVSTIAGLLKPDSGSITFDGEDVAGHPTPELVRRGIALCPEGRRVFPELSVKQNLKLGAWTRRRNASEVEESEQLVYEYFPVLGQRPNQAAGTMSGGEQQMLAIGRALMAKSKLLLLDEPSMGLAPKIVEQILETISSINKSGVTVLLVEQNAAMALAISHRGYVLETGQVILEGLATELAGNDLVRQAYLGG